MTKLHELLAAQETPTKAANVVAEDTLKKFKNVEHFFSGEEVALQMIEQSAANEAIESQAKVSKPVVTTVYDTLEYNLGIWAKAEDVQYQKNQTNCTATGTVMWNGVPFLIGLPVDELLGLESRLVKLKELIAAAPTQDASLNWVPAPEINAHVFKLREPLKTTKTEKTPFPFEKSPATDKHPAQVEIMTKDAVVGTFSKMKFTGTCTAVQKSDAIVLIDDLLIEIKQARMRANETVAVSDKIAAKIVNLILEPFKK